MSATGCLIIPHDFKLSELSKKIIMMLHAGVTPADNSQENKRSCSTRDSCSKSSPGTSGHGASTSSTTSESNRNTASQAEVLVSINNNGSRPPLSVVEESFTASLSNCGDSTVNNDHWWNEDCAAAKKLHRIQRKHSARARDPAVRLLIRRAADRAYQAVINARKQAFRVQKSSLEIIRSSTSTSPPSSAPVQHPTSQEIQPSTALNPNAPVFVPAHLRFAPRQSWSTSWWSSTHPAHLRQSWAWHVAKMIAAGCSASITSACTTKLILHVLILMTFDQS